MRIAIQQPYYYPYLGFFRLFAATDLFVILDSVQFNRRGRVHRRQFDDGRWETLPIKKTPRDTTMIKDLQWQDDCAKEKRPVDYIVDTMRDICTKLSLPFNTVRSSDLDITSHGQALLIDICKHFEADQYINSPGGRSLYSEEEFSKNGIKLSFLPDFENKKSVADRLTENYSDLRAEIYANL